MNRQLGIGNLLCSTAEMPQASGGALWRMELAGDGSGLGWQLDLGLFYLFFLERRERRNADRRRKLCAEPKPVLREATLVRSGRSVTLTDLMSSEVYERSRRRNRLKGSLP